MDLRERTRKYAIQVIRLIKQLPQEMPLQIIARQLLRSTTSVGANIMEAKGSPSKRDFINFFHHSLKSANESLFWFEILKEIHGGHHHSIEELLRETKEISNILGASLLTLKGKRQF